MGRLLILACSQRKKPAAGLLPAIDRYDGPTFRVLRKFLTETPAATPTVLVLSAKYGLIDSATKIPNYDRWMSADLAERLRPAVRKRFRRILGSGRWQSVAFCVGRKYQPALDGVEALLPAETQVEVIRGGQGQRLTGLRRWLRHKAPRAGGVAAG
jgi:hypothetical protein